MSILFGVLAFFAVSAMSIQSVDAQNPVKKSTTTEKQVEKKADKAVTTDSKAVKKDDCCANKATATEKKTDDCCANKKVDASEKKLTVEKKDGDAKKVSIDSDSKKERKHDGKKPHPMKGEKSEKAANEKTEK